VSPQPEWEQRAEEVSRDPEESGLSKEEWSREADALVREYADEVARSGIDRLEMESRARALLEKLGRRNLSGSESLEAYALLRILALQEIREGRASDKDGYEFAVRWTLPPGGIRMRTAPRVAWLVARKDVLGEFEEPTL
jgi:hypothetical protein